MKFKILGELEKDAKGKYTCVEGEASGHNHAFMDSDAVTVFRAEKYCPIENKTYETLLAVVKKDVEFSHYNINSKENSLTEEHATLLLKPNVKGSVYEIVPQREVDLDGDLVRVLD